MNEIAPFTLQVSDLASLGQDRAVEFFRRLLWAEATRKGIGRNLIDVPQCINVGDGGIDAFIREATPSTEEFIPQGTSGFQIKSADLPPVACRKALHQREDLNEPMKEEIKRILDEGGTYVLVLFSDKITKKKRTSREKALEEELLRLGYTNPKFHLYTANQLVGFAEHFPALVAWFKNDLNQCLPYSTWAGRQDVRVPKRFVFDQNRRNWMEEIRQELRNPGGRCLVFRITGLSGIGKTRFVFETLSADDLKNHTIYVQGHQFRTSTLHNMLQNDESLSAIVVIDECDSQLHDEFVRSFCERGSRLAILTLSYDISKVPPPSTLFKLNPLGNDAIKEIVEAEDPQLPESAAIRLSEFADGYPRIAVLLSESYRATGGSPDEFLSISDEALMNRLIGGRSEVTSDNFRTKKRVLMGLSLFRRVGYEGKLSEESKWVAKTVNVDWSAFKDVVAEQNERGIIQGQHYVYVTPFMLRIYLLREWWEAQGLTKKTFVEFAESIPQEFRSSLLQRFFEHIPYIAGTTRGKEFAEALLGEGGPFTDGSLLKTDIGGGFFLKLTEADPTSALRLLRKTVACWSRDDLMKFTTGRREVVWALEMIAMWRDLFSDAARLLLALGEAENENVSNNASGVFGELFSPAPGQVAPTEAPPEERFPILEEALNSDSKERRLLALRACDEALESQHFVRDVGAEYQGLRPIPKLWTPKTYGELYDAYRRVWDLITRKLDSLPEQEQQKGVAVLINRLRGLAAVAPLQQMVMGTVEELAEKAYVDKKLLLARVVEILHYDGNKMDQETRGRWEEIKGKLTGIDFSSLVHRYAGMALLEDRYDEHGNVVDQARPKIKELAQESVENPELLKAEMQWLVTSEAENGYPFGYELGLRDTELSFLPTILDAQKQAGEKGGMSFLGGYYAAIRVRDTAEWENRLDDLARDNATAGWVPELTWRSGMSDRAALRILALAVDGVIEPASFGMFRYGSVIQPLSAEVFAKWISFLLDCDNPGAASAALGLHCDYYLREEHPRTLPEDLTMRVLTQESFFTKGKGAARDHMDDFLWEKTGEALLREYPARGVELADRLLAHFGEEGTILEGFHSHAQSVLNEVSRQSPGEVWQTITEYLGPPIDSRAFHIRQWLRGGQFYDTGPVGALQFFPLAEIWRWVDEDVGKHAWYLASFVPKQLFREADKVCLAREVLVRYGQREEVRRNLIANFSSEGWSGPASVHLANKKRELLEFKKDEEDANVRRWIDEYVSVLDADIKRERIEEEKRGF